MRVSHEVPIDLLEKSRTFNDYDYALVHLFKEYPEYYNFFVESLKQGRDVILDNSLFELGEMFDHLEFATACLDLGQHQKEDLNNFAYIVPDVMEDKDATISSYGSFTEKYDLPGKNHLFVPLPKKVIMQQLWL